MRFGTPLLRPILNVGGQCLNRFMAPNIEDYDPAGEFHSPAGDDAGQHAQHPSGHQKRRVQDTAPSGLSFGPASTNLVALDAALTHLESAERLAREAEAVRVSALAEIDRVARLEAEAEAANRRLRRATEDTIAYRTARAEAAVTLRLSEHTIGAHLAHAATLTISYPAALGALSTGLLSLRHTTVIVNEGRIIDVPGVPDDALAAAKRAAYESQVLDHAKTVTPQQLRPIARRIAETFAHESLDSRYEKARKSRRVWVNLQDDGMAELCALLPAHQAMAAHSRLVQMARQGERAARQASHEARSLYSQLMAGVETPTEPAPGGSVWVPFSPLAAAVPQRTLDEFRADIYADLLLHGTGDTATGQPGTGIAGHIQIITDASHLDGTSATSDSDSDSESDSGSEPKSAPNSKSRHAIDASAARGLPEMAGFGPIPVEMARDIAASGTSWNDVTVHLPTGTVLAVETYRPDEAIKRFLAARDLTCRFPGCRVPVHRCDFDHTIDAANGGPTSTDNLGALCRGHHVLKHHSGWKVEQRANGDYDWTSPTGRGITDTPPSKVLFRPYDALYIEKPSSGSEGTAPPNSGPKERGRPAPQHGTADPNRDQDTHPF